MRTKASTLNTAKLPATNDHVKESIEQGERDTWFVLKSRHNWTSRLVKCCVRSAQQAKNRLKTVRRCLNFVL
eukprot:2602153-Prymnesium_polylepis.1